jgi:hypothetical protein
MRVSWLPISNKKKVQGEYRLSNKGTRFFDEAEAGTAWAAAAASIGRFWTVKTRAAVGPPIGRRGTA